jgi:hypothetical protein
MQFEPDLSSIARHDMPELPTKRGKASKGNMSATSTGPQKMTTHVQHIVEPPEHLPPQMMEQHNMMMNQLEMQKRAELQLVQIETKRREEITKIQQYAHHFPDLVAPVIQGINFERLEPQAVHLIYLQVQITVANQNVNVFSMSGFGKGIEFIEQLMLQHTGFKVQGASNMIFDKNFQNMAAEVMIENGHIFYTRPEWRLLLFTLNKFHDQHNINTNAATIQKDLDSAVTETPELEKALDEFAAFLKQHEIPANSNSEVEMDDEDEEDDDEGEEL